MLMGAYRPRCPILAVCRDAQIARQLHLHRGIYPVLDKGIDRIYTHYLTKIFYNGK